MHKEIIFSVLFNAEEESYIALPPADDWRTSGRCSHRNVQLKQFWNN